jgi:hypothetical protein
MAGTYPNLDHADLNTRVRTYLGEASANFFTDTEIARWLSIALKYIAQKSTCIRHILDAHTKVSERNVVPYGTNAAAVEAYKVHFVEYVPASGRPKMLKKIDPLRVGHETFDSTTPEAWFEFGGQVGIEPTPDAEHDLRLYVSDAPKIENATFPIIDWSSGWTGGGTGTWTNAATAAYVGTTGQAGTNTWGTTLAASTPYTFIVTVSGVSNCTLTVGAGTTSSITLTSNGIHAASITSSSGSPALVLTATMTGATGGLTVDDLYILKEADLVAAGTEQTELDTAWQHLAVLLATAFGLRKDRKIAAAQMLESIVNNEIEYMRQNIVEIIPDGRASIKYS